MRPSSVRALAVCATAALAASVTLAVLHAAVPVQVSPAATQNFDSIGTSATATLPADFRVDRTATATASDMRKVGTFAAASASTTQAGGANLSTSATNGIYNFGSGTSATGSDRAIGFLASGSATASGNLYVQLTNSSGGALSGLQIAYDVEKYRNGSNLQGFRIQLFYSTDGTAWTSAGTDFTTAFAADANNSGFVTAPGATVSVNKTLNVAIPANGPFYLAWNYSVSSGSTVTNAQALAVDNISIAGVAAEGQSTSPTATLAASPSSGAPGTAVTLTASVTPGTNPASTGLAVSGDLSQIGGSAAQPFYDDATHGDAVAGDNQFTFATTIGAGATSGSKTVTATITDAQARTATAQTSVAVDSPSDAAPAVSGVTPQNGAINVPASTNVTVTFSEPVTASGAFSLTCGGSAQPFAVTTSGNTFTLDPNVDLPNLTSCTVLVAAASVSDLDANDPPDHPASDVSWTFTTGAAPVQTQTPVVISQLYGGGGNGGATYQNDFVELFNRGASAVDSPAGRCSTRRRRAAAGASFSKQPLGGTIGAGRVLPRSRWPRAAPPARALPAANISGQINMSGHQRQGRAGRQLRPGWPATARSRSARHGLRRLRQRPTAAKGRPRRRAGQQHDVAASAAAAAAVDTDDNAQRLRAPAAPSPRRTAPIVELGPLGAGTDPRRTAPPTRRAIATIQVDLHRAGRRRHRLVHHRLRQQRPHTARRLPTRPAAATTTSRRTINFTSGERARSRSQGPGARPGYGRRRPEHRHAAGRLLWSFTVASDGTMPPFPPSVHLTMGNPTRRGGGHRPAEQLPDGEAGVRAVLQPRSRPPELGELAPVARVDRHADPRRHVPPRSAGAARLVSRAGVRLLGQRLRSRPHDAQRRPRQGNVDPDQPGDVPDVEHGGAGARQQPGPVGGARGRSAHACRRRATSSTSCRARTAPAAPAATAA